MERIRRYAKQYYGNDFFEIIPVHLLAAQMSREEDYGDQGSILYEASRITDFLDSIRMSLINNGVIRRSQTLLGSTVADIERPMNWVRDHAEAYETLGSEIHSRRAKILKRIDDAGVETSKRIEQDIQAVFQDVAHSIHQFAENNWESSEDELNKEWNVHLKSKRVENRLTEAFKHRTAAYSTEVAEILEELGKDLELVSRLGGFSFALEGQDSSVLFKKILKWSGTALGIVGTVLLFVPGVNVAVAIAVGVASAVAGIVSALLKTKAVKQQEAVEAISSSLRKQMASIEQKIRESCLLAFSESQRHLEKNVNDYFEVLEFGIKSISAEMQRGYRNLVEVRDALNKAYAKRVVDWSENTVGKLAEEDIDATIVSVERKVGRTMSISVKHELSRQFMSENAQSILQEETEIMSILEA